jgi:hypothetical protein
MCGVDAALAGFGWIPNAQAIMNARIAATEVLQLAGI